VTKIYGDKEGLRAARGLFSYIKFNQERMFVMKILNLLRKRNRKTKIIRMKPDTDGNVRVIEVMYDDLKNTRRPPAWMTALEEQWDADFNDKVS